MTHRDEKTVADNDHSDSITTNSKITNNHLQQKLDYHTPGFVRYGSITSIVKNLEGTGGDGGGGFADDTLS